MNPINLFEEFNRPQKFRFLRWSVWSEAMYNKDKRSMFDRYEYKHYDAVAVFIKGELNE